ncbi:hypothetical protein HDU97_000890 [Phlyctochytrium planicorne]|nr:hypothetical protein HDU97_000878 [Phlyctochytrium planicorne]KAJ3102047.1 hypothetical protein HDU97_000890 [Phlyctochytrium planicorne]
MLMTMVVMLATMVPGSNAEIQAYFKACRGNWEFQAKFRYPAMVQMFMAKSSEFSVIDCAIRCSQHFKNQIGDYVFIGPADFAQNPATVSMTSCNCVSKTDPDWMFDLENIPGMNDNGCIERLCSDGQKCGAVDQWGVHYASYLIDNPSPSKPIQELSKAAVEMGTYGGMCGKEWPKDMYPNNKAPECWTPAPNGYLQKSKEEKKPETPSQTAAALKSAETKTTNNYNYIPKVKGSKRG